MCFSLACTLSPRKIILGGGVMAQAHLLPRIREELAALANGYLPLPEILTPASPAPALQGALALARSLVP
jgi:fructokinase